MRWSCARWSCSARQSDHSKQVRLSEYRGLAGQAGHTLLADEKMIYYYIDIGLAQQ